MEDYQVLVTAEDPSPALMALAPLLLEDMRTRHPCRRLMDTWTVECEISPARPSSAGSSIPVAAPSVDRGMGAGVEVWRSLVAVYDWNVEIALCLMAKESGGNPNAFNKSGASGLMQVLASWADNFGYQPADLFIPEVNLAISYALYADGGWNHWAPWLRGSCR